MPVSVYDLWYDTTANILCTTSECVLYRMMLEIEVFHQINGVCTDGYLKRHAYPLGTAGAGIVLRPEI